MKPAILNDKIDQIKKSYKATAVTTIICKELDISSKTLYRYLNDIKLMPVDKALKLYLLVGLDPLALLVDLSINPIELKKVNIYYKLNPVIG